MDKHTPQHRSVALFASYFERSQIPLYIRHYLTQLRPFFTEVQLLTNEKQLEERDLQWLKKQGIELKMYPNLGFDFGLWYRAFGDLAVQDYEQIALVNDSCILFRSPAPFMEWVQRSESPYCALLDSNEIYYHLQSYFLVIKKAAIPVVYDYFMKTGIIESDDIRDIVQQYEMALPQQIFSHGWQPEAFFSYHYSFFPVQKRIATKGLRRLQRVWKKRQFAHRQGTAQLSRLEKNPMYYLTTFLIDNGFPLVKKNMVLGNYRRNDRRRLETNGVETNPATYIQHIEQQLKRENSTVPFSAFVNDLKQ